MSSGSVVFWVYLSALGFMTGVPAVVLGWIARYVANPFDTASKQRTLAILFAIVVINGLAGFALMLYLTSFASMAIYIRLVLICGPLICAVALFRWASGFPLRRRIRPLK